MFSIAEPFLRLCRCRDRKILKEKSLMLASTLCDLCLCGYEIQFIYCLMKIWSNFSVTFVEYQHYLNSFFILCCYCVSKLLSEASLKLCYGWSIAITVYFHLWLWFIEHSKSSVFNISRYDVQDKQWFYTKADEKYVATESWINFWWWFFSIRGMWRFVCGKYWLIIQFNHRTLLKNFLQMISCESKMIFTWKTCNLHRTASNIFHLKKWSKSNSSLVIGRVV